MNNGQKKGKLLKMFVIAFLALELLICISFTGYQTDDLQYSLKYDISPLKLTGISIINRSDMAEDYELMSGNRLYEVVASCENIGSYTGNFRELLDLTAMDGDDFIYQVYPKGSTNLIYEDPRTQVVPVGQSASLRWFYSIPEDVNEVKVTENGEFLSSQDSREWGGVIFTLPKAAKEETKWEAQ